MFLSTKIFIPRYWDMFIMTRYIFVTGGVVSGLGKGVITASIGKILKSRGFSVTAIKIDPYLNYDAGTLRPTEHGEVWVTDDGGEIDQDLGHYERFLDITLSRDHNITSGKIYYSVIEKERRGRYLGQTVQPIPHVTDEIKSWIYRVSRESACDFTLVEIGGVVGDYENILFLEAARQMRMENPGRVLFVHVAYVPILKALGEMKTKPVQHSVKELRAIGIQPDFIVARCEGELDDVRRAKISLFTNVEERDIFSAPDLDVVYELPLIFEKMGFGDRILEKFGLKSSRRDLRDWENFVNILKYSDKVVTVGIVGKYFRTGKYNLPDAYISVIEAVKHASASLGYKPGFKYINSVDIEEDPSLLNTLSGVDCIIIPGGFGATGVEGKMMAIKYARENKIPTLGLCYGFQLMVVEFSRNVVGLEGAHTTEVDRDTPYPVITILPEQSKLLSEDKYGGTMRLGSHKVIIMDGSLAYEAYGNRIIYERFRHRYEVNPEYVELLERHGFIFSGMSEDGIKQLGELRRDLHPFFVGSQFHPEFTSRPLKPNPLFRALIKYAVDLD